MVAFEICIKKETSVMRVDIKFTGKEGYHILQITYIYSIIFHINEEVMSLAKLTCRDLTG